MRYSCLIDDDSLYGMESRFLRNNGIEGASQSAGCVLDIRLTQGLHHMLRGCDNDVAVGRQAGVTH